MRIHIHRNGQAFGPCSMEEIHQYLSAGQLLPSDLAWSEGATDWQPLAALAEVGGALLRTPAVTPEPIYHHVSPVKFCILSLFSLGLYELFWYYRNWKFLRQRARIATEPDAQSFSNILPFWRAVFSPIWCYSLAKAVNTTAGQSSGSRAAAIAVVYFVLVASWKLPEPYWLVSLFSFVPLLLLVWQVDAINRARSVRSSYYSQFRTGSILMCLAGGALLIFVTLSAFNWIPSTQVITGDRLSRRDVAFLHRNDIVKESETILYYYSAGVFSIKEDGNILTNERVISYYYDEDEGGLVIDSARFDEIADLDVTYSRSFLEDTEVYVILGDGDADEASFLLYLSAEAGLDRTFVNDLRWRWKAARNEPPGEPAVKPTTGDDPTAPPRSAEVTP